MLIEDFLQSRTDRIVAAGRVVIAAFALAAIWVDDSQPTSAPDFAYGLMISYLAFAGVMLIASRRERVHSAEFALGSHLIDLAVFSTLMFLTEGPTSPFFLLFTFSMLSAAFRWQWKGALWTAAAVLVLLILTAGIFRGLTPGDPFAVERLIIRCAHVVVIGAMLVYFGFRQQRTAEEAAQVAAWQPDPAVGTDSRSVLSACLAHVANVFAAPRVVLVLQRQGDPDALASIREHGAFRQEQVSGDTLKTMVPDQLADLGFIRRDTGDVLFRNGGDRLSLWRGAPVAPDLAGSGLEPMLSVPVQSAHATGRLFIADKQDFAREELNVASLVAAQIGVLLDRVQVIEAAHRSAATEERLRLARDLHDGILQTLAGTALQLETVRRLADQGAAPVSAKISEMQSWLANEQREVRGFIGKLRPTTGSRGGSHSPEPSDLQALVQVLEQQWGAGIRLPAEAAGLIEMARMDFHLRQILREAVANAVRHGGASQIGVAANLGTGGLELTISDNGKGLPEHGRFDERQSAQSRIGPRSLRERVVSLGGSMVIDSTPGGVTLSITLPLRTTDVGDAAEGDRSDSG